MAFAAQLGEVPPVAWLLLAANVFWAIAYDTEYAMVDRDDDIHLGIHSAALLFGRYDVAAVMACYAITLGLLAWAGQMAGLGRGYYGRTGVRGGHCAVSLYADQKQGSRKMLQSIFAQQLVRCGGVFGNRSGQSDPHLTGVYASANKRRYPVRVTICCNFSRTSSPKK